MIKGLSLQQRIVETPIGGEIQKLRYNMNTLIEFEKMYGSIDAAFKAMGANPKFIDLMKISTACYNTECLSTKKKKITVVELGEMLQEDELAPLGEAMKELFEQVSIDNLNKAAHNKKKR